MLLKIETESAKLNLETNSDLPFEQLFKAYQIVTGDTSTLNVENSMDEDNNSDAELPSTTKFPSSVERGKRVEEKHQERLKNNAIGSTVKVDLQCPMCGYTKIKSTTAGYKYCKCPVCHAKVFMRAANGEWGVLDDKGCYYHAYEIYNDPQDDDYFRKSFGIDEEDK